MEEKERFEYYPKQNQLYDKINDELYCLGIKQDKTRLVDFLNLMNEVWWTLYERNKELREENKQLKQQLLEYQEQSIRDNQNWIAETTELKQQLHDLPKKIVEEIRKEIEFPLYVHPDFDEFECLFDIDKLLGTILKKYKGEKQWK